MSETAPRPNSNLTAPMILLVAFNLLPGIYLRPYWSTALCFVFLGYRFFVESTHTSLPPRGAIWFAQGVVGLAIWQHYHSIFGDEAAGTLLTLLTCLKTFELRSKRDYFVNSLLCFMVLMSNMLLDQSLLLTAYVVADVIFIVSFLYALESGSFSWRKARGYFKPTFMLILKATPLLVACFVLFPRFSTGFGTGNQTVQKTGITDELKPGTVSKLVTSEELVFRATYVSGEVPPKRTLYWRGAILDEADGLNWTRNKSIDRRPPPLVVGGTDEVEIYLEPGFERFLFSQENSNTITLPNDFNHSRINRREGGIFELNQPLQNRERYMLYNFRETPVASEIPELARYLRTAQPPTPEMQKLLRSLKGHTDGESVGNVLALFRNGGFEYSMSPPASVDIDQFIFRNKSGFCEHYAAAMGTMLRQMKVPARVVLGFQGGTQSILDKFITVRGQDAHAWLEYWDTDRWRRVDPTAQVAPARLTEGAESYMQSNPSWLPTWLVDSNVAYRRMRAVLDEAEANWIGFLLRFDLARQKELLAKFGMEETLSRALPFFLLLTLALIMAILYFIEAQKREKLSREERLYRDVVTFLGKWKIRREPGDGPLRLMDKVRVAQPRLVEPLAEVLEPLVLMRFGGKVLSKDQWRQLLRRFRALKKLRLN